AEIDAVMAQHPYLHANAVESTEQASLQHGLLASQQSLAALKQKVDEARLEFDARQAAYNANPSDENSAAKDNAEGLWQALYTHQSTLAAT
ncbi:hypothetical protein RSW84_25565, partial [Escherichia coli]